MHLQAKQPASRPQNRTIQHVNKQDQDLGFKT